MTLNKTLYPKSLLAIRAGCFVLIVVSMACMWLLVVCLFLTVPWCVSPDALCYDLKQDTVS